MEREAIIQVSHVQSRFGAQLVHEDISCEIAARRVTAIIGGSGSGKTVLLKELIGLLQPAAGRIEIEGRSLQQCTPQEALQIRNSMGVLFQNGALFSALNVGQNVAVPLRERTTLPPDLIHALVILKLGLSGLGAETAAKMPAELSGGMRKRVALARALALDPRLLFLDEPTSGLDPPGARAFDELVKTLRDSLGLTVVMVTHDLDTLAAIADQIIVLGEGRVLAQGAYREVAASDQPWIRHYFSSRTTPP